MCYEAFVQTVSSSDLVSPSLIKSNLQIEKIVRKKDALLGGLLSYP